MGRQKPTAKDIARYLISQSVQTSATGTINGISNLHLQKVLFYAQAEYYQKQRVPLFTEPIEAWRHGPVVATVYDWLKGCGAYPLSDFDIDQSGRQELPAATKQFLDGIWRKYSRYSAWYLADKTHRKGSAWSQVYQPGQGRIISLESLTSESIAPDNRDDPKDWPA